MCSRIGFEMLRTAAVHFIVFTAFIFWQCSSDEEMNNWVKFLHETTGGKEGFTKLSPDEMPTRQEDTEERMRLFQYDPKHKGHVHNVSDEKGRVMSLITAALKPRVFEIHNFLSSEECDHLIGLALRNGLDRSETVGEHLPSPGAGDEAAMLKTFDEMDQDENGRLDPGELAESLDDVAGGLLPKDDVITLMKDFQLDSDSDGHLDFAESKLLWTPEMTVKVKDWVASMLANKNSTFRSIKARVSDQTWLHDPDEVLARVHERLAKLLQLPVDIVFTSESLQVVRYKPGGHYHGHHDSDSLEEEEECSHTEDVIGKNDQDGTDKEGKLCRFATVLFYLNDVPEGGETAFPFADSTKGVDVDKSPYDPLDFSNHCYDSNLVVKPEKGKAILWYNHEIDPSDGWLGELIDASLHGGCDVRAGEKWVANKWINVDEDHERQRRFHASFYERSDRGGDEDGREEEVEGGGDDQDLSEDEEEAMFTEAEQSDENDDEYGEEYGEADPDLFDGEEGIMFTGGQKDEL